MQNDSGGKAIAEGESTANGSESRWGEMLN